MGKLSADPLSCCAHKTKQTYFQSLDKFTVGIAGRRLGGNYQAIDFLFFSFTVGQIQSLVVCRVPTVKFKVIKGMFGSDVSS